MSLVEELLEYQIKLESVVFDLAQLILSPTSSEEGKERVVKWVSEIVDRRNLHDQVIKATRGIPAMDLAKLISEPLDPPPLPDRKIRCNVAKCLRCGDVICSLHVHDFNTCRCGNLSVDGGREYLKRLAGDPKMIEELSVFEKES